MFRLFSRRCRHERNTTEHRWFSEAGTALRYFLCFDCGHVSEGVAESVERVIDPERWAGLTVHKNGRIARRVLHLRRGSRNFVYIDLGGLSSEDAHALLDKYKDPPGKQ